MKTNFKVAKHEVYLDIFVKITLDNGDDLMLYTSSIDDVLTGDYDFEFPNGDNTYLITIDNCKPKTSLIEKLLFIKIK